MEIAKIDLPTLSPDSAFFLKESKTLSRLAFLPWMAVTSTRPLSSRPSATPKYSTHAHVEKNTIIFFFSSCKKGEKNVQG